MPAADTCGFPTREELDWVQWWFDAHASEAAPMSLLASRMRPRERASAPPARPWASPQLAWLAHTRGGLTLVRQAAAHYALVLATQVSQAEQWLRRGWPAPAGPPGMAVRRWAQSVASVSPLQPLAAAPGPSDTLVGWGLAELRASCRQAAPGLWPRLVADWGGDDPAPAHLSSFDTPFASPAAQRRSARCWQQAFGWALEAA